MHRSNLSRVALWMVLTLLLAVPSLYAGEPARSGATARASWDFLARVWEVFSSVWSKNGCRIDPSGLCVAHQSSPAPSENGCGIDPNGLCVQSTPTASKNGCRIDPDGLCRQ